jgi:DNA polymerase I
MQIMDNDIHFNLRSGPQMQEFLYEFLNLTPLKDKNEKGNYSVAEDVMLHYAEKESIEFCKLILNYRKLEKAKNTYIAEIKRNITEPGFLVHPSFWMHSTETYRSSATNPPIQQTPKHGDILPGIPWKRLRKLFKKLGKGWLLAEVDYIGAETKIAAMLSGDPQMIYDLNHDLDMHSHWAGVLFGINKELENIKKEHYEERFLAKNNFTFANFFGATPTSIAEKMRESDFYRDYIRSIWEKNGSKGNWYDYYKNYSEEHIKQCQDIFYERYPTFKAWQNSLVDFYYQNGYIETPFGFRRNYPLKRNEIINFPIQSVSFHFLLHALIKADKLLMDAKLKSHIIAQIHDSGMLNLKLEETPEVIEILDHCMTQKPWAWAKSIKLETEWEVGHNWLEMKPLSFN